jgi:D-alanyl-D-alanine carboxypeptidase
MFVERMNEKARALGLASTHYANPHGLPDPVQRTTAEDLARLTERLLEDHPASRPLLGGATFIYRGRVYARRIPLFQDPGGVQALKTGFTREAGYNLSVAAWRAGERFLLIVLGAQTRSLSFRDARALLEYGFHETGIEPPAPVVEHRPLPSRRVHSGRHPRVRAVLPRSS